MLSKLYHTVCAKGVAGNKEVELGTQVHVSLTEDVYIVHRLD